MNGAILLWSLLLFSEVCMTDDPSHTRDRIEGTEAYLVYSFGAMLVWVLGAGLHLLDHLYVHQIVARWSSQQQQQQEKEKERQETKHSAPEEQRLLDDSCIGYNTDHNEPKKDATTNGEESTTAQRTTVQRTKWIDFCAVLFEFVLSVNFLDYSRRALSSWNNTPDYDVADEFIDIMINIGAFSYQVVRLWKIRAADIARELAEIQKAKGHTDDDDDDADDTTVFEGSP
ncbi:unnamed protein product [Cylindrotheca closterium]|uniref:Uncharacterized protein n=1 Tax=Cylindrotheca closterium TaxID=2856 RepID=A0AAD2CNY3_9STRA|nr:unnamed protein product [Cylindrotheca closterium]